MSSNRQTIVVGILYNQGRDKVLISKRADDVRQGGLWEFPGGKLINRESQRQALERELFEELNIKIKQCHHFNSVEFDYPDINIKLCAWVIDQWAGKPVSREGQHLEWANTNTISTIKFPAANQKLIKKIKLPLLYLITPDLEYYDEKFFKKINSYLSNGLAILQFRSTMASNEHQQQVVRKLVKECKKKSCNLLVNGTGEEATRLGAHGVHLQSSSLMKLKQRPLNDDYWVAGSCHNSNEIIHASKIGLDFCVLSPVHSTKTHPEISGFGWTKFGNLAEQSTIPIYALGGIHAGELKSAQENGAHGIAMITGLWNSNNPESIIEKLK